MKVVMPNVVPYTYLLSLFQQFQDGSYKSHAVG